jgi:glycosyltransferase involved in cell wall biosynthesis
MQDDDYRISIIITSYNKRDYLVEAIESVIGQTFRPHEIIIADDGSSDGSRDTIRDYMARYPGWIRGIFQEHNVGIPRNRNSALHTVTGNYVGILDGDDLFLPTKLEKQVAALRRNPAARVVYSNFRRVEEDGSTEVELRFSKPQPQGDILADAASIKFGLLRTLIADYDLVKAAGFMDERYTKCDGLLLSIQLAGMCEFAYVHEPLVNKRNHPGSDSVSNTQLDSLHDNFGIFYDIQPLLSRLDEHAHRTVNERWKKRLIKQLNKL